MIDKYCKKSRPLGYKEELTSYSVSKRNVKDFFNTSKYLADDVKVSLATFFLASYSIFGELYS